MPDTCRVSSSDKNFEGSMINEYNAKFHKTNFSKNFLQIVDNF